MFYSEATDLLKALGIIAIILVVGIVLAIIGIQHEHLTKLRDRKAELEIMNQDLKKKNEELEKKVKELSKYDRKMIKAMKKEEKNGTMGINKEL